MVYDYVITLKGRDYRFIDQVSQLMYMLAIVVFGYFFYMDTEKGLFYPIIIITLVAIWVTTRMKLKKTGFTLYRLGLLVAAVGFFYGPTANTWMGVLYAIASILERVVKTPKEVGFTKNVILFNTFPKKKMLWQDMNNVVIKDGLITIDQKNNKLLQKEIEGNVSDEVEQEFNEYCRMNLMQGNE